jgi:hypothetical protein
MTEILVGADKKIDYGEFNIHKTTSFEGKHADIIEPPIFHADGSQASILLGWGIALNLIKQGKQPLLAFNPEQEISFPENQDE